MRVEINQIKIMRRGQLFICPLLITFIFFALPLNAEYIKIIDLFSFSQSESPWFYINTTDKASNNYLGMGWGPINNNEFPSRFIVAQKAKVKFPIRDPKDKFLFICLKGLPEIKDQIIEIWLNDFPVSSTKLNGSFKIYKFFLPQNYQLEGDNNLTFKFNIFSKILPDKYLSEKMKKDMPVTASVRWILISDDNYSFASLNSNYTTDFALLDSNPPAFILKSKQKIYFAEKLPDKAKLVFSFFPYRKKEISNLLLKIEFQETENAESFIYTIKDAGKKIELPLSEFSNRLTSISFEALSDKKMPVYEVKIIDPTIEYYKQDVGLSEKEKEFINKAKSKIKSYNLVILSLDAASASHFSVYNYSRETTPFLKKLSKESLIFNNAFTNSSFTLASIISLFTGLLPSSHGVLSSELSIPNEATLLSEYFKEAGFKTAAFTGNYFFSKAFGFNQGFDYFYEPPLENILNHSSLIFQEIKNWINANTDNKFFIFAHFREPHVPYHPPTEFSKLFWNKTIPSNIKEYRSVNCTDYTQRSQEEIDYIISQYDALIRYMDSLIENFFAFLQEKKLSEKTIVIIISDHGQSFWQHQIHTHSLLVYDEIINIPFIIKFPAELNIHPNKIENLIEIIDVMPTLIDLYSLNKKNNLSGISFALCLLINQCPQKAFIISRNESTSSPLYAIRDLRFKLIASRSNKNFELYDIKKDPSEKVNIFKENSILSNYFLGHLQKALTDAMKFRYFFPQPSRLTGEVQEKLRALGYVD